MSAAAPTPRTSRVTAVRTPGAAAPTPAATEQAAATGPTTANGETDADALARGADDLDDGASAPGADGAQTDEEAAQPTVTLTQAALEAMLQRATTQAVANTLASQRAASQPMREAELPDQDEVDITAITRPTLSKQGYVVPKDYGTPKALLGSQLLR